MPFEVGILRARLCWRPPLRDYRVRMKYVLAKQGVLSNIKMRDPFPGLNDEDRREIDEVYKAMRLEEPRFLPAGKIAAGSRAAA